MNNRSQSNKITIYGPYSPIKNAGNLYFVSGQVGVDPVSKKAPIGIRAQTKQVILNLKAVLATKNLSLENLVKTTVYLSDMTYFAPMNEVYANYFENIKPARATIAVSELPRVGGDVDIVIEIDAVAYKGDQNE